MVFSPRVGEHYSFLSTSCLVASMASSTVLLKQWYSQDFQILTIRHLQDTQICALYLDVADSSSSIGTAVALPRVRGRNSPCVRMKHRKLQPCIGYGQASQPHSSRVDLDWDVSL